MTTNIATTARATVDAYFAALAEGGDWKSLLAENLTFTNHAAVARSAEGREQYLAATARFFGMITDVQVLEVVADGDRVFTASRYTLAPPAGDSFTSDVAELFTIENGAIAALDIYFDTAPYATPVPVLAS